MRTTTLILLTALLAAAPLTGGTFHPAAAQAAGMSRYLVTLSESADDLDETVRALVAAYGGRPELYAREGFHGFLISTSESRARLLSTDPRVLDVTPLAGAGADSVAPPVRTVSPAASTPPVPSFVPSVSTSGHRAGTTTAPGVSWSSGPYVYDGSGNIASIGADTYLYDTAGRMVGGTADAQRSGASPPSRQDFSYDGFGNRGAAVTTGVRCAAATDCALTVSIDPATNHLTNAEYDDGGNIVRFDSNYRLGYDGTGRTVSETVGDGPTASTRYYIYGPDDHRIAVYDRGTWNWGLRDTAGRLIREIASSDAPGAVGTAGWTWKRDYIYRGTRLLAEETPAGRWHLHLDHLGTARVITGDAKQLLGVHSYYPYGGELDLGMSEQPENSLKFAGEERDSSGDVHALDYLHARYMSAFLGRFMSIDPVDADPSAPRTWNRYAYALNNPIRYSDPSGMLENDNGVQCFEGPFFILPEPAFEVSAEIEVHAYTDDYEGELPASEIESRKNQFDIKVLQSALHLLNGPDYWTGSFTLATPGAHMGVTFSITETRDGEWFFTPAPSGGVSTGMGGSLTAGYVLTPEPPNRAELHNFIVGHGATVQAGAGLVGGVTWGGPRTENGIFPELIPGNGAAVELGLGTPQVVGASVGKAYQLPFTWGGW